MGASVRFLHSADLHIGAPVRGVSEITPVWEKRLDQAFVEAFDRLVDTALRREVDFVILAGDCFDTAGASFEDRERFKEALARLHEKDIPVYGCAGNHDPLSIWRKQFAYPPEGLVMFPEEAPGFAIYEKEGRPLCALGGRSYGHKVFPQNHSVAEGLTRETLLAQVEGAELPPFCVGIIHSGLDIDLAKAPVTPAELKEAGLDYWALGHLHKAFVDDEAAPTIGFPGCIQGRDLAETGPKGAHLVTLEVGCDPKVEFIPLASVVFEQPTVDISLCESLSEVIDVALRAEFTSNGPDHCEYMITRITLTGKTKLHDLLTKPGVLEEMRRELNDRYGDFFCDALWDRTMNPREASSELETGFMTSVHATAARMGAVPNGLTDYLQDELLQKDVALGHLSEARTRVLSERALDYIQDLMQEERS